MYRISPAGLASKIHSVKVTTADDFDVKDDVMEFYAQPFLFEPEKLSLKGKHEELEHKLRYIAISECNFIIFIFYLTGCRLQAY